MADFPREPRDDAEREACDNFHGEWCFSKGPRVFCTRRKGHTGKHVGATAGGLLWAEPWPAAPGANTPETPPLVCSRCQRGEPCADSPVAAPDVRALVEEARQEVIDAAVAAWEDQRDYWTLNDPHVVDFGDVLRAFAAACGSKE